MQTSSTKEVNVLDEIINTATDLPLESQCWVLMIAKAMRYTRNCVARQSEVESHHKPPK